MGRSQIIYRPVGSDSSRNLIDLGLEIVLSISFFLSNFYRDLLLFLSFDR
jgi:hypothetical protein